MRIRWQDVKEAHDGGGEVLTGSGDLTVGEGAWTSGDPGSSRLHGVLPGVEARARTNPEELLAAAHPDCCTMRLSFGLQMPTRSRPSRSRDERDHTPPRDALPTAIGAHLQSGHIGDYIAWWTTGA